MRALPHRQPIEGESVAADPEQVPGGVVARPGIQKVIRGAVHLRGDVAVGVADALGRTSRRQCRRPVAEGVEGVRDSIGRASGRGREEPADRVVPVRVGAGAGDVPCPVIGVRPASAAVVGNELTRGGDFRDRLHARITRRQPLALRQHAHDQRLAAPRRRFQNAAVGGGQLSRESPEIRRAGGAFCRQRNRIAVRLCGCSPLRGERGRREECEENAEDSKGLHHFTASRTVYRR